MKTLSVLTCHGIGSPKPDYAAKAMAGLATGLKPLGYELRYRAVHYDPLLAEVSRAFENDQRMRGMDSQLSSRIVTHTLADALVGTNARMQARIHDLIDTEWMKLRSDNVVMIGHSMGNAHLISWLNSRKLAKCSQLVTMATNTAFWYMGDEFPVPPQVAKGGRWLSVVDKDDPLGCFMEGVTKGAAVDLEVSLGGWLSWGAPSHCAYWTSRKLFSRLLPSLLSL